MTVMEQRGAYRPTPPPAWQPRTDPAPLLPDALPYRVLGTDAAADADPALLRRLYAELVRGRRYNTQATALTKQGRLAVYPSSTGQEACEVAAALVLEERDWLFPSYRDTLAAVARGLDPVQALTLLRGDWHTGYDPHEHRVAPLCTPLATQLPHAVGLAHAARLKGDDVVALALVGDGGTSEGDFHEALNFAAVWQAPVVFLVQNNGFAISVPLAKQTAAPSLAHKAVGYGMPGRLVDGNDAAAVHQVLAEAVAHARAGGGPTLVEAVTYRIDAHTNADDATRYRGDAEVETWRGHDPIALLEHELTERGLLDEDGVRAARDAAETMAADLRERMNQDPVLDPMDLFAHVYAEPTPQLREQEALLQGRAGGGTRRGAPMTTVALKPATMAQALNRALRDAMTADPTVHVMGEDVGALGGVFRVTDGLAKEFGEDRGHRHPARRGGHPRHGRRHGHVRAQAGRGDAVRRVRLPGVRAAHQPRRPHAQPHARSDAAADHHPRPVRRRHRRRRAPQRLLRGVLHGDSGAPRRHARHRRRRLWAAARRHRLRRPGRLPGAQAPVLVEGLLEPRRTAGRRTDRPRGRAPRRPQRHAPHLRPVRARLPGGRRGGPAEGWDLEVVDLRSLVPFDDETVAASVRRTGRAVVVHESGSYGGPGGEIAARVTERCFHHLEAPVLRVAGFDIPYPPPMLERHHLPGVDRILDAVGRLQWEAEN